MNMTEIWRKCALCSETTVAAVKLVGNSNTHQTIEIYVCKKHAKELVNNQLGLYNAIVNALE